MNPASDTLRRIVAEKRAVVLPLVVALLANVAAYVLVVRPRGIKSAGAADRAAAATQALRAAEQELAGARALVEGKVKAEEELDAFYKKVLPADLVAARRMTYSSLPALARKTNVKYEQRRSSVDDITSESRLGHLNIRLGLSCDYESFRDFIYQLETAPEFVIIDDVTLTEANQGEPLALIVNLSTYFRLRPDGA
jgi:hypothetical protein